MALSPFPWRDNTELLCKPLLTSLEALSAHIPLLPTQEVRRDDRSTWTLYQEDRKDCLELLNTDLLWRLNTVSISSLQEGNRELLWILQIERVESVIYFLEILTMLSPVPRTHPNQELTGLP